MQRKQEIVCSSLRWLPFIIRRKIKFRKRTHRHSWWGEDYRYDGSIEIKIKIKKNMNAQGGFAVEICVKGRSCHHYFVYAVEPQPTWSKHVLCENRQNILILSSDVVPLLLGHWWRVSTTITLYLEMQRRANPFEEKTYLVNSQKIEWLIWKSIRAN